MKRLRRSFFNRDTNIVARELLGKKIVRVFDDGPSAQGGLKKIEAVITETEAYHGFDDKASHASRKKTERNKVMFEKPGLVYVYLIYGMHHCLNFVTMKKDFPAAVLIRSVRISNPTDPNHPTNPNNSIINGPGRVCKALGIDRSFYGEDLTTSKKIWIESVETCHACPPNGRGMSNNFTASKRIGVDYAEECKDWEWNYKLNP